MPTIMTGESGGNSFSLDRHALFLPNRSVSFPSLVQILPHTVGIVQFIPDYAGCQ